MTEVERLQAAIEHLQYLWGVNRPSTFRALSYYAGGNASPYTDLTLTLHRTIAAQLAILSYGATLTGPIPPAILGLASAILGEQDT